MKCDIGHLHTPCTPNPNFHFTLFFGGFSVPPNTPWHIPLVYYDPNLSHAPKVCPIHMLHPLPKFPNAGVVQPPPCTTNPLDMPS